MATTLETRPVFNALTLTGSYVTQSLATHLTASYIETTNVDQISLGIHYTMGTAETANSVQIKIEVANPTNGLPESTDWEQLIVKTVTAGSEDLDKKELSYGADSAAGTYDRLPYNFPIAAKYVRFSVKETGIAANGGTLTLKATLRREQSL